jgi:hypothetical protein
MRSESVKEIATALSNFQGKMTAVKKDSTNHSISLNTLPLIPSGNLSVNPYQRTDWV